MKIKVKGPSFDYEEIELNESVKAEEIVNMFKDKFEYPIYLCKVNNCYRGLSHNVYHDCEIEFFDMRNQTAWYVYQNSLILLYLKATHDVLGKDVKVTINNSLNKGLFTVIKTKFEKSDVKKIEEKMFELVEADLPIVKQRMTKKQAISLAKELKQEETINLLSSISSLKDAEIFSLVDEINIFYGLLVPSTGYLTSFELVPYKNGVLLRFPHMANPSVIPKYQDQSLLYGAFSEATRWGQLMNVNFASELNDMYNSGNAKDMMLMQEALHEKKISDIADEICSKKRRLVLICGPSSSGKTTFAKRLCIQLNVNGAKTLYMGTDDYFVERDETPLDENGEKDFENIGSVDTKLFVKDLKDLLDGKEVDLPTFNFITGSKEYGKRITKLSKDHILVIEGIHALNKILTDGIDDDQKYKIYISPLTAINIDSHNRIPTTDIRLLRRMVRDYKTRGMSVQATIDAWPKVRKGEEINIFPFNGEADAFFNSYAIYETAVIKRYIEPLLMQVQRKEPQYAEAQKLLSFLRFFVATEDEQYVLNNSIVREFIGGSVIVD